MSDYKVNPISGVNRTGYEFRERMKEQPKKKQKDDKDKKKESFSDILKRTMEQGDKDSK